MGSYTLSRREDEIVTLAIEGLTNDAIANTLNLSVGTVNTYWSRVRMKVGGVARTDTVAKIIADRSEDRKRNRAALPAHFPQMDSMSLELRAVLSLFQLAKEDASSAVWAIEKDMTIQCIAAAGMPSSHDGVTWEVGKTIFEVFGSTNSKHPAIAAHLKALNGKETTVSLNGAFKGMKLRTVPLLDEDNAAIGCVGVLSKS
ncbi:MAG: helix-turn-helix transcriptional regulator [Fimbriimonadaceae bacterium]